MKKIFTIFTICFLANQLAAQKLYFTVNGGYALESNKTNLVGEYILYNLNTTSATNENSEIFSFSLGKGVNFGGAIGYMFHKNIGAELGVNYLIGAETTGKGTSYTGDFFNRSYKAKMLQFKPSLLISAGFEKINPYVKFGLLISTGNVVNESDSKSGANTLERTTKLDGGIGIGFTASAGISYGIAPKIAIIGELNYNGLTYSPKKGQVTASKRNGVDDLATLTTRDKETEFSDTFIYDSRTPLDPNKPSKSYFQNLPLSSLGFNIGLRYNL
jgi:Outer membrane protein beta-barrel domain